MLTSYIFLVTVNALRISNAQTEHFDHYYIVQLNVFQSLIVMFLFNQDTNCDCPPASPHQHADYLK